LGDVDIEAALKAAPMTMGTPVAAPPSAAATETTKKEEPEEEKSEKKEEEALEGLSSLFG
jgi:large subunit ribosomal protein L12